MKTATKKPITVEYVKYDGSNESEVFYFTNNEAKLRTRVPFSESAPDRERGYDLYIKTKEGDMIISQGDYVIKEPHPTPDRKFYPCKPEIFLASYDIND